MSHKYKHSSFTETPENYINNNNNNKNYAKI